jgi:hypothetical protein
MRSGNIPTHEGIKNTIKIKIKSLRHFQSRPECANALETLS